MEDDPLDNGTPRVVQGGGKSFFIECEYGPSGSQRYHLLRYVYFLTICLEDGYANSIIKDGHLSIERRKALTRAMNRFNIRDFRDMD